MPCIPLAQQIGFPRGISLAQGALGRIALTCGNVAEAETYFLAAGVSTPPPQGLGHPAQLYLDLAELAHVQGNRDNVTTHLSTSYAWFKKLRMPRDIEKAEDLARTYGVTLHEVVLEDLPEEPS